LQTGAAVRIAEHEDLAVDHLSLLR
jgi:hypothetical protein